MPGVSGVSAENGMGYCCGCGCGLIVSRHLLCISHSLTGGFQATAPKTEENFQNFHVLSYAPRKG